MANRGRLNMGTHFSKAGNFIQANLGIFGVSETQRWLSKIPDDLKKKALRKGIKEGAEILRKQAYQNTSNIRKRSDWKTRTSVMTFRNGKEVRGKLRSKWRQTRPEGGVLHAALNQPKSILMKTKNKIPIAWVGATKGKYGKPYDAWYQHFYEFGTKFYKKRPQGYMYMFNAFKSTYNSVSKKIGDEVKRYFEKLR